MKKYLTGAAIAAAGVLIAGFVMSKLKDMPVIGDAHKGFDS